ncbi:MAG: DUF5666 domain-containing protein [Chloroflexia bacterium]
MIVKRVIGAVVGLLVLGALAAAFNISTHPAAAQTGTTTTTTGTIVRTAGKVSALQSNGFTLQSRDHTWTVSVGANTWIVVSKSDKPAEGALSDVKVGDMVMVAGTSTGTNQVAARVVTDGKLAAGMAAGRHGFDSRSRMGKHEEFHLGSATVQSVSGNSLSLTVGKSLTNTKTITVNTDAGTIIVKGGLASLSDLKAGDKVTLMPRFAKHAPSGTTPGATAPATKPTPTAAFIYVASTNDNVGRGLVKSVTGNTVALGNVRQAEGQSFNVDSNTIYKTVSGTDQAPASASLADIKAGTAVVFYGPKPATGQTATASLVLILPNMRAGHSK